MNFLIMLFLMIGAVIVVGLPIALLNEWALQQQEAYRKQVQSIADGGTAVTPEQFFKIRESYKGHLHDFDFMGCYVIHNLTKNMFYVGQATHVPQRVNNHFTGKGNGDVYADYKYGNQFEIRLVNIMDTEYSRLDDLERDLINAFDAYDHGYNKTRGNK